MGNNNPPRMKSKRRRKRKIRNSEIMCIQSREIAVNISDVQSRCVVEKWKYIDNYVKVIKTINSFYFQ